ncbi:hypothetical protein thsps117_03750 [Pseudomonas sp. No.117]
MRQSGLINLNLVSLVLQQLGADTPARAVPLMAQALTPYRSLASVDKGQSNHQVAWPIERVRTRAWSRIKSGG